MGTRRSRQRKLQLVRNYLGVSRNQIACARDRAADRGQSAIAINDRIARRFRTALSQTPPAAPRTLATDQGHAQTELSSAGPHSLRSARVPLLNNGASYQGSPYDTPPTGRVQNGTYARRNAHFHSGHAPSWNPGSPMSPDAALQAWPQAFSESARTNSTSNGGFPALAGMQRMHSTVRDSDIYSQPSIGVRSSLVDTDSWYVQQKQQLKWRQQRASRIQSIAATGRDSFYAGVPSTPTYSTTSSSIRNSKADAIDIESATDFGDPVMDAHTGDAPASQIMLTGDNSQATTMGGVAPAFSTNNAKCQGTRDSSILWMHNAGSNAGSNAGGEQSQHAASPDARVRVQTVRPAGFRRSGSWHMGEHGGAFDALQSDRIMFYSSQTGAVRAQSLQKIAYQDMGLEPLVDAVQSGAIGGDGSEPCFWLDVSSATAHELHRLSEIFGLHPLTVEDIEQKCSRDKIDTFDDYQVIVYHTSAPRRRNRWQRYYSYCRVNSSIRPATRDKSKAHSHANPPNTDATLDMSDDEAGTGDDQILIVLKSSFVLTFHSGSQQDVVSDVLKRLLTISTVSRQEQDAAGSEIEPGADLLAGLVDYPAYIVYAILDQITDQLTPEIAKIEAQVDAIDELVLILSHAEHESVLQQMGEQRRQILRVWQLTQPKSEVITALARALTGGCQGKSAVGRQHLGRHELIRQALASEVVQYLGDVQEHLLAIIDACTRAEAVLSRSHSNYLAKISLELSRATFDSNATTERWTMLGTIVVPINILSSLLGVNLKIPGQDRDDTLNFFVVLACMLIYACVTLAFWRWRRIQ